MSQDEKGTRYEGECPSEDTKTAQAEIFKLRFDYAWKYFEFHAKQRTTMYNFFLVFSALIISALINLIDREDSGSTLPIIFSFIGFLMTLAFVFLDRRNEELVHFAELVLKDLEKTYLFKDSSFTRTIRYRKLNGDFETIDYKGRAGILTERYIPGEGDAPDDMFDYSHAKWLPRTQYLVLAAYLLLALIAF
tara:strand:+ start:372 stop:947 length:576 start_codon:yes stop_codon:yes gene_type:complete